LDNKVYDKNLYIFSVTYTTNNNQIHTKYMTETWNPIYINLMVYHTFQIY